MGFKKFLISASIVMFSFCQADMNLVYANTLKESFLNNSSIIYAINIRTFNADDKNGNGIIDFDEGETSGTFLNAINRLDELKNKGITAIHVLPITPVGKMKALGTAGSLYSASSFNTLNPQLKAPNSELTLEEEARKFVDAAHEKGIFVIVDVPACGSYDLFLQRPELFVKDTSGQPVVPADWTDVRLLDAGNETQINEDVLRVYKEFVDLMIRLGVDGIRADVAHSKPAKFWKELIDYSRKKDSKFFWLAESSDSWRDAVSPYTVYTPYDKLLKAGFDGYYGSFFNLKNWKTASELEKQVNLNRSLEKIIGEKKSVIGSFTTHDELSPILEKGSDYSKMIMWLSATLPLNSYFVDGVETGDNYIYFWANRKAAKTYTDDEYYFVHRGKIDIFNFSRKPGGQIKKLNRDFVSSNSLKSMVNDIKKNGEFKFLKTGNPSAFAYTIYNNASTILVVGNLDFNKSVTSKVSMPNYSEQNAFHILTMVSAPVIEKNKMTSKLEPGEIQVYLYDSSK